MKNMLKRLTAISVALMVLWLGAGSAFAETLVEGNGNAYFYFQGESFGANTHCLGFAVNAGVKQRVLSATTGHTETFDKTLLNQGAINTITVYTGNSTGFVDETKSRDENRDCDEFSVNISYARLILPNGKIVKASYANKYIGKDNTSALNDNPTVTTVNSGGVNLGDNNNTYAYKVEIIFDLTEITYTDITASMPAIKNVSLEIGAEPSKRNIVWYSTSENAGKVQLALSSAMTGADFPADHAEFAATAEPTGYAGYTSYKATMTGLNENCEYVYRVGDGTTWSDTYSFKTQSFTGDFSFLAVADPQLGQGNRYSDIADEIAGWTTTLNKAKNSFYNDVAFLASMGDQISKAEIDGQYDAFFKPESLKNFTLSVVPGNHDIGYSYTPHYNMPNVSDKGVKANMGSGSGDYYFTYGDALFIGLNLMSDVDEEHLTFVEETVESHPDAKWKFVMMHYAIYGSTEQSVTTEKIAAQKAVLAPVFSRLGIDVVFQGHEHCYARSYMMNVHTPNMATGGNGVTQPDPSEVLYLTFNSASGTDYVTTDSGLEHVARRVQQRRPNFSKIDVTDNTFTVTSYFSDSDTAVTGSDLVDAFTITRDTTTATVKSVHITQKNATVKKGLTQQFNATALGYNNPSQEMNWSISGNESANTTISSTGLLTVDSDENADSLVVTATAKGDSAKYASVNVALESSVVSVNAVPGKAYTLPAEVEGVAVTGWTNAQGEAVNVADTSKTGYRYYKATLANGTTAKYRVNVGAYVPKYEDLLGLFALGCIDATKTASQNVNNANGYIAVGSADAAKVQVVEKDSKKAVKFESGASNSSFIRTKPTSIGGEYKLDAKIKIEGIDITGRTSDLHVSTIQLRTYSPAKDISLVYVYVTPQGVVKLTAKGYSGETNESVLTNIIIDEDGNTPWISLSYNVYDNNKWSLSVNGTNVFKDKAREAENYSATETFRFSTLDKSGTTVYCADVNVDVVHYFEGELPADTTAEITQCATGVQSATVTLTMSDTKTESFDVEFTADATAGSQTVYGSIDGFDDTLPISVIVKNVITDISVSNGNVASAAIQKVGAVTSGVAVFALYNGDDSFQSAKIVPFSETDFTDGVATLNIGLAIPAELTDSYVKGFVFENLTDIIPIDVAFSTKQ